MITESESEPPNNVEVERSILGMMLMYDKTIPEIMAGLDSEDFYIPHHSEIFTAISEMFNAGKSVDIVTVANNLKDKGVIESIGGLPYLSVLTDVISSFSAIPDYCRIVKDKKKAREMISLSQETVSRCYGNDVINDVIDDFGKKFFSLAVDKKNSASFLSSFTDGVIEDIKQRCESENHLTGIATGFSQLDKMLSGLQKTDLIILAGRPSMGKTASAMNMVRNAAKDGHKCLVFSLEMSKEKLVERMLADVSMVSSNEIRNGYLNDNSWPKINRGKKLLESLPILIDDSPGLSIVELRARAKMAAARHGVDFIMVDYMQLLHDKANNREREISQISASLKALAKELGVPVLALSQLNRSLESRADKRPIMSDLRDSGSIEQDADVIMFVYRDEVYNKADDNPLKGLAEIIVSKQRNGSTGFVKLAFLGEYSRFEDLYDNGECFQ